MRDGKANVKVVSSRNGGSGGIGSTDWRMLAALVVLVLSRFAS